MQAMILSSFLVPMCSSKKISILIPQKGLEFPRGWGDISSLVGSSRRVGYGRDMDNYFLELFNSHIGMCLSHRWIVSMMIL